LLRAVASDGFRVDTMRSSAKKPVATEIRRAFRAPSSAAPLRDSERPARTAEPGRGGDSLKNTASARAILLRALQSTLDCVHRATEATRARADDRIVDLLDAVQTQLALESLVLRALRADDAQDLRLHALAHGCMRLALLRAATSASSSVAYARSLREIEESCSERSVALADLVGERLDARALARLEERLSGLARTLGSRFSPHEAARAVVRCELSLRCSGTA
jgi:hypothetical protein